MPRLTAKSKKPQPLTLGELAQKIGTIKFNQVVYVALLVSIFMVGYLYSEVRTLKKGGATGTTAVAGTETTPAPQPKISLNTVKEAFNKSKIKFGKSDAKLVVIEVADPSCPYCHIAGGHNPELNSQSGAQFTLKSDGGTYVAPVPEFKKLLDEGKISFSYIYYPGHANGDMATKALYCAHDQGKFWEAHDLLMNGEGYDLINNTVKNDATQSQALVDFLSGTVDATSLKDCIDGGKYDKQLKDDQALATQLQIQGTPGFYLNETSFPGAYNFTDMADAIKKAGI